jgi:gliding motility-associated-like protein
MKFKKLLTVILLTIGVNYSSLACHAIALVNFSVTNNGTFATVNASSDSPTCGCQEYWLDVEVRCVGEPFDAAQFNPGFWGPLGTYPYFQSAQMFKADCVVQPYPPVTIPFGGLCPGTTYQVRARENHEGQVGPWTTPQTFTVPGVLPPLECEIQASSTNICVGDCVDLDAVIIGGCGLAASFDWDLGGVVGPPPPPAQCSFSICLYDTFGDGWNGGAVTVLVNGVAVLTNVTLNNGAGPVCYNFNVIEGQTIQVNYSAGQWSNENNYRLFEGPNGTGNQFFNTTAGQTPPTTTNPPNPCGGGTIIGDPSVNVCPTVSTTYSVTITELCSGQQTQCAINIQVLPPPVAGTATISDIEICAGQTVDLNITGHDGLIQWQSAPSAGGPWVNIPGGTDPTFTSPPLNNNTCYQAVISGCGAPQTSNTVCVTVLPGAITGLTCPAPLSGSCNISEFPPYANLNAFVTAGGNVVGDINDVVPGSFSMTSEVSDGNSCPEVITRTYQIAASCGSVFTCEQTITLNDLIPPTASNPAPIFVTTGVAPAPNPAVVIDAADNCGAPLVAWVSDVSDGNDCPETITRTYSVTDACGNQITVTQLIIVSGAFAPTLNGGPDQTVCAGTEVVLTAFNPDGAVITWNNGVSDGVSFIPPVGTTTYTVTADLDNCISIDFVNVTVHPIPNVNAGNDVAICPGQTVVLTGSGASTYAWDNGITNGVPFTVNQTTTYTVTGTQNGCSATDQVTVIVNPVPNVTFATNDYQGCAPVTVSLINTTSNVNSQNCSWSIQGAPALNGCDVSYTFNSAGCYTVGLTVTSDLGCTSTSTINNFICIDDYPVASFQVNPIYVTTMNGIANFTNTSVGASTYQWNFGDGNTSTTVNPSNNYISDVENNYLVQMIAYSPIGCPDTAYTVVQLREELVFYIPNTFTPDFDAFNQTFQPIFTSGFEPMDYHLTIFNRWGETLFESYDAEVGWDGTYGGKIVQEGTYIWKIEFGVKYTDERKTYSGHINLLK